MVRTSKLEYEITDPLQIPEPSSREARLNLKLNTPETPEFVQVIVGENSSAMELSVFDVPIGQFEESQIETIIDLWDSTFREKYKEARSKYESENRDQPPLPDPDRSQPEPICE